MTSDYASWESRTLVHWLKVYRDKNLKMWILEIYRGEGNPDQYRFHSYPMAKKAFDFQYLLLVDELGEPTQFQ